MLSPLIGGIEFANFAVAASRRRPAAQSFGARVVPIVGRTLAQCRTIAANPVAAAAAVTVAAGTCKHRNHNHHRTRRHSRTRSQSADSGRIASHPALSANGTTLWSAAVRSASPTRHASAAHAVGQAALRAPIPPVQGRSLCALEEEETAEAQRHHRWSAECQRELAAVDGRAGQCAQQGGRHSRDTGECGTVQSEYVRVAAERRRRQRCANVRGQSATICRESGRTFQAAEAIGVVERGGGTGDDSDRWKATDGDNSSGIRVGE